MIRIFFMLLMLLVFTQAAGQCPQLVWSDEFDGNALDLTKWEPMLGDGCNIGLCGWGNNELEYYRAENATVGGGTLKITAKREDFAGKSYTSARLRTKNRADFTYGRMEAALKLPRGQGIWPAFWMLSTYEPYGGWPQSGEIDIMELIGSEPDVVHGTIHYGNPWPNNQFKGESYKLHRGEFGDAFHEFAIEWEPGQIRWYVDGYLYSTKKSSDVSPFRWPFDKDFHFLLNVAVGGNWPGRPNSGTSFPQVMEVDYVRVYNMSRPSIAGNRKVANLAQGEVYAVQQAGPNAAFNWRVPNGAAIVSGQGTNRIQVNWGPAGGKVEVDITSTCGVERLSLDVLVEGAAAYDFSFENFDDPARITYAFSTGTFVDNANNPNREGLNISALAGSYTRSGADRYDILVYETSAVPNAAEYVEGKRQFYLDVYTNAPPGTEILLQLENSFKATSANYPTGRHSRFQAHTFVQNQWERLVFKFLDRPDPGVASSAVNQLIFLFAPNTLTTHTYRWDNFDSYQQGDPATSVFSPVATEEPPFTLYPNPAGAAFTLEMKRQVDVRSLQILDVQGKIVRTVALGEVLQQTEIDVHHLAPGAYLLRMGDAAGRVYQLKFVKE